jgi:small ligand-binding sensory domain FIST
MRFLARSSQCEDAHKALEEVTAQLNEELGGAPDLVVLFTARHPGTLLTDLAHRVHKDSPQAVVLGATAEATLSGAHELEGTHSISLMAAQMPGVHITPLQFTQKRIEAPEPWTAMLRDLPELRGVLILADPFSTDVRALLEASNAHRSGVPIFGGLASAARMPGGNTLFGPDGPTHEGVVGLAFSGAVRIDTLVSQGCKPIGRSFVATRCEENLIYTLRGRPALEVLREVLQALSPEDEALLDNGIFVGRAIDEYRSHHGRGDFLMQGLLGANPQEGVLAIAGEARTGMTIQFHLRDALSADEDLRQLLEARQADAARTRGALVFSCNGRGLRMWQEPHHDAGLIVGALPGVPVAGFFAAGELGPVGPQGFVHGFTASVAFFSPLTQE